MIDFRYWRTPRIRPDNGFLFFIGEFTYETLKRQYEPLRVFYGYQQNIISDKKIIDERQRFAYNICTQKCTFLRTQKGCESDDRNETVGFTE